MKCYGALNFNLLLYNGIASNNMASIMYILFTLEQTIPLLNSAWNTTLQMEGENVLFFSISNDREYIVSNASSENSRAHQTDGEFTLCFDISLQYPSEPESWFYHFLDSLLCWYYQYILLTQVTRHEIF